MEQNYNAEEMPRLTLEKLKETIERINQPDPLEKKGIPRDWVCVLHPRLEYVLKDHFKVNDLDPSTLMGFLYRSIEHITGRKTFIISSAPDDKIEYMPEKVMRKKYASYFEILTQLHKESDNDRQEE